MDPQNKFSLKNLFTFGTLECGIFCAVVGAVAAVLLLSIGILRTLLIGACGFAGFLIGAVPGKMDKIKDTINKLFPPKGE